MKKKKGRAIQPKRGQIWTPVGRTGPNCAILKTYSRLAPGSGTREVPYLVFRRDGGADTHWTVDKFTESFQPILEGVTA